MNPVFNRINTYSRHFMVNYLAGVIPLYIINEYPKSGGTWLGQMLSSALNIPFPRNRFPFLKESILHGHYVTISKVKNVVIVWRDGRDVMISWYYHCLFLHEHDNDRLVRRSRKALKFNDYEDILNNLPEFMEYVFTRQPNPGFSWSDFVDKWTGNKYVIHVLYEDLHEAAEEELQRIVYQLTGKTLPYNRTKEIVYEFSFKRQSSKTKDSKNCFLRKGIIGDWRNHFSNDAKIVFDRYAGEALIRLGYEKDHSWVSNI
jgi:hypothetical protein